MYVDLILRQCRQVAKLIIMYEAVNLLQHESALSVVQVLGKGRGVVAVEPLLEGQVVCEYEGELITAREGRKRGEEYGSNVGSYLYFFHYKSKHLW